jgi:hypothetical protein
MRTAWYIDFDGSAPRFVTVHPLPKPMNKIKELDAVALTCDVPEYGLKRGDVGTAVLEHREGEAIEVEFVDYKGRTVALLTLENSQIRMLHAGDIPHARELTVV